MNTTIKVIPSTDELMQCYNELAGRQNIDATDYAREWRELAEVAAKQNRPALAGMCYARAQFYGLQQAGEYVRLLEGSFSELLHVSE